MATNLYEVLDLHPNATPEEIRKAYKKKALKTHPDRLSPDATPAEKQHSAEKFRQVNNAYEVLIDVEKRRVYDLHGSYPPPEVPPPPPPRTGHEGYRSQPRYRSSSPSPYEDTGFPDPFVFTDPFVLFDNFFNTQSHHRPHDYEPRRSFTDVSYFDDDPFASRRRNGINILLSGMGGGLFSIGRSMQQHALSRPAFETSRASRFSVGGGGQRGWTSESTVTQTINGVTHSRRKRRDWDGNEHVTITYPDGRTIYTLNGVEQPQSQAVEPPSRGYIAPSLPGSVPPPPVLQSGMPPPPPYSSRPSSYHNPEVNAGHSAPVPDPAYSDGHETARTRWRHGGT
ncbi:uncharacterized protein EV420DRAFT_1507857 [Desarmillaria tabescens]|uniref:J domain-containing protein n=1 Tax=Armillaria tabescens TaxID=1929756 RepID=A0AA39NKF1_ARMTA|nr:uncharacterized protein EV420DRAFT_1507857 [Desarmillaria tabescens]KAK0467241.1 hypothetical protein EV420DRAFT_1507857 [Desarmillaria tabescens]